jgi:thyrotropin receptor
MKIFILTMLTFVIYGISSENATFSANSTIIIGSPAPEIILDPSQKRGWECHCWISKNEEERECRCEGSNLLRMPQKLNDMHRLTITTAGMVVLRAVGLKVYGNSLQDM